MCKHLFSKGILVAVAVASSLWLGCYGAVPEQKLLMIGQFHGDEVHAGSGGSWLGLFPMSNGEFELRKTRIKVDTVYDPIVDDRKDNKNHKRKTGKAVSVPQGDPLLLVRDLLELKTGRVPTAFPNRSAVKHRQASEYSAGRPLKCGQTIMLKCKGRAAQLVVSGQVVKATEEGSQYVHGLKVTLKSEGRSQILYGSDDYDLSLDDGPKLIWAGDLDGDGKIDLLVDTTNHYNVADPTLFLSSLARHGKLVKRVAEFRHVGC